MIEQVIQSSNLNLVRCQSNAKRSKSWFLFAKFFSRVWMQFVVQVMTDENIL